MKRNRITYADYNGFETGDIVGFKGEAVEVLKLSQLNKNRMTVLTANGGVVPVFCLDAELLLGHSCVIDFRNMPIPFMQINTNRWSFDIYTDTIEIEFNAEPHDSTVSVTLTETIIKLMRFKITTNYDFQG